MDNDKIKKEKRKISITAIVLTIVFLAAAFVVYIGILFTVEFDNDAFTPWYVD